MLYSNSFTNLIFSNKTKLENTDHLLNQYFYEVDAGDCLFRSLSYGLTGTPEFHKQVRAQI